MGETETDTIFSEKNIHVFPEAKGEADKKPLQRRHCDIVVEFQRGSIRVLWAGNVPRAIHLIKDNSTPVITTVFIEKTVEFIL